MCLIWSLFTEIGLKRGSGYFRINSVGCWCDKEVFSLLLDDLWWLLWGFSSNETNVIITLPSGFVFVLASYSVVEFVIRIVYNACSYTELNFGIMLKGREKRICPSVGRWQRWRSLEVLYGRFRWKPIYRRMRLSEVRKWDSSLKRMNIPFHNRLSHLDLVCRRRETLCGWWRKKKRTEDEQDDPERHGTALLWSPPASESSIHRVFTIHSSFQNWLVKLCQPDH